MSPHRLSKSRVTYGVQCERQLWWRVHEPDAPELVPAAGLAARFATGHRVGEAAQRHVPGGLLIEAASIAARLRATKEALAAGASVLYEPCFEHEGVFCAVDILERGALGWRLVEVKATTSVKPQHLDDVAIQLGVVRGAGLTVERAELMHLNRGCRFPQLENLFVRADVTAEAELRLADLPATIERLRASLSGPLPDVEVGRHCDSPYPCPFMRRCHPVLPEHHVTELHRLGDKRAAELVAAGCSTIHDVGEDVVLPELAARQARGVREGRRIVEPGLRKALETLERPFAWLDFETVMPPIPTWRRCRPYRQVPVQLSVHRELAAGGVKHVAWLADGADDPREELVDHLLHATGGAGAVLTWNAAFEKARIRELAEDLPNRAQALAHLERRIVDLMAITRRHVYDPDFRGKFSLKCVLPVLCPELGYDDLEIADGGTAATLLETLLLDEASLPPAERATLRDHLLRYCERDTWALVRLTEVLLELAGAE